MTRRSTTARVEANDRAEAASIAGHRRKVWQHRGYTFDQIQEDVATFLTYMMRRGRLKERSRARQSERRRQRRTRP